MPDILSGGVIDAENFDELANLTRSALIHSIEQGEVPEWLGPRATAEDAVRYATEFLDTHRATLVESSFDFLASLIRRLAVTDEAEDDGEAFEAALSTLSDEQLVELAEADADAVEAAKVAVIDRRRALVADLLETGKTLLRGALATGLHALLGSVGGGPIASALLGGLAAAAEGSSDAAAPGSGPGNEGDGGGGGDPSAGS